MAKRNANDRNEIAIQKAKRKAENLDTHTLDDGTVITLKDIDPIFLQTVMATVEYPEKPVYDVTLASGRVVQYPMDKEVAEQTPDLKPLWEQFIFDQARASNEELKVMTGTMLLDGTQMPENWHDAKWERRMKIIGARLPDDPEERWVLYLRSKMSLPEILALTGKIMRRTGVPEEYITAAEDSFRDQVSDRPGRPDDLVESKADPRGDEKEKAGQVAA